MIYPNSEGKKILYEYYMILWMFPIIECCYMEYKSDETKQPTD